MFIKNVPIKSSEVKKIYLVFNLKISLQHRPNLLHFLKFIQLSGFYSVVISILVITNMLKQFFLDKRAH